MMPSLLRRFGHLIALACACSGCVTEYDLQHRQDDGWQVAKVEQIGGDLKAPRSPADDCRAAETARSGYADVWFVDARRRLHRRIVLLPTEQTVGLGDMVYVNLRDCRVPVAPASRPRSG